MTTTENTVGQPLSVTLLPPVEAVDYEWHRLRLAEPELVDQGVAICLFRIPMLAVPVSRTRRGGFYAVHHRGVALAVRDLLAEVPGFPDLRIRHALTPSTCQVVEWGGQAPLADDPTLGQFYGYRHSAIAMVIAAKRDPGRRPSPAF
ncbi:DUF6302 family protein (plasmid) [Streptomyces sp. NBC_00536]|uniref:DUF6302 family protein n=1 Tax=Streptomyces sp. NBC_00536 TaxID=2975769 RepID=UPI002E80D683|nr:DUF6302 family protein [Streptomyces sp. NBC_00536]WUC84322.1 DUF6302 family protein [Streptomyces sp. NBC_00536]